MIPGSCTHRTCILSDLTFVLALVLPLVWVSYVSWASASENFVCHGGSVLSYQSLVKWEDLVPI